jgi:hypothetical protein
VKAGSAMDVFLFRLNLRGIEKALRHEASGPPERKAGLSIRRARSRVWDGGCVVAGLRNSKKERPRADACRRRNEDAL